MSASMYQDTLFVRLEDIKWVDADLADTIQLEWIRVEPHLRQAVQQLVRKIDPEFLKDQDQNDREFYIAWEGIDRIDRLRDLRSAKACLPSLARTPALPRQLVASHSLVTHALPHPRLPRNNTRTASLCRLVRCLRGKAP